MPRTVKRTLLSPPRTVLELGVKPKMIQHLLEVRFSAPVEATDPSGRLDRRVHVAEVGLQDTDQAVLVLAFADEVLELVAERFDLFGREGFAYGGDAVVEKLGGGGIALEDLSVLHRSKAPLCSVIGTAR